MIDRSLDSIISAKMKPGKVFVLIGPRQVGKTTLIKAIQRQESGNTVFWNCDEPDIRAFLLDASSTKLRSLIGDADLLILDEAQRVQDIGLTLKLIVDSMPGVKILVTGSSALELSNSINEPLTGRKIEYQLYPLSFAELGAHFGLFEAKRLLEDRLIYGSYPEIVMNPVDKRDLLGNLVSSYLFKDVFAFQDIRKSVVVEKLLQALALQIGSEVSFSELSRLVGIDSSTVHRYVDLLEKAYVVFHLRSYSRNVRNELKKSVKIYFYDNGVRNALIGNFSQMGLRNDVGALWENYLISERKKILAYAGARVNSFFWRTAQRQEIDYLEESDGALSAWEFKYNPTRKARLPLTFSKAYPGVTFECITPDNFFAFLGLSG